MKSLADKIFAFLVLIILLPFLVIISLLIFIADFGSPFFVQERIGINKKVFKIIKFRTMKNGKVTFVGKVLRRTGIDELPQMINILLGHMSFIGPRPLTQADIERLGWTDGYYDVRWKLKPGIMGLAQLSPVCHKKMSWHLDRHYIEQRSMWLDTKIFATSLLIPIVGKSVIKSWMKKG